MTVNLNISVPIKGPAPQKDDVSEEMAFMNNKVKFTLYKSWIAVVSFFERIGAGLVSFVDKILNPKVSRKKNESIGKNLLPNGIPNLGNTCYMGACVQAIAGNEALEKMFRGSKCDKPIKKRLLDLIDAIKDPDAKGSIMPYFTKKFEQALTGSGWQKDDKRPRGFKTADSEELLRHLQETMGVTKKPTIVSTKSYISVADYTTNKNIDCRKEIGRDNDGVCVTLNKDTPTLQAYFDRQVKGEMLETVHEINPDGSVGKQVEEREVLWSKVQGMKDGVIKESLSELFKYDVEKKSFGTPCSLFSKGSKNYQMLVDFFGKYENLEKEYCESRPQVRFCRQSKLTTELVNKDSEMIAVTIQNPNKSFNPDEFIKANGLEFRLSGMIKRTGGNHYTYCSRNMIGEFVNFDDKTVNKIKNTSFARIVFYERVKKIIS